MCKSCSENIDVEKKVYKVSEVAEILSVSTNTVYKLIKQNAFSSRKVGRDIRILKNSFDTWLADAAE